MHEIKEIVYDVNIVGMRKKKILLRMGRIMGRNGFLLLSFYPWGRSLLLGQIENPI